MAKGKKDNGKTNERTQRRPTGWIGVVNKKDASGATVQLPGFYWRARGADGRMVQRHGGDTREEAEKALARFLGETRPDPATGLVGKTLASAVKDFVEHAESNVSEGHAKRLDAQLTRFRDSVGKDVAVRTVSRSTVESYLAALRKEDGQPYTVDCEPDAEGKTEKVVTPRLGPATQRRHLSALGAFFEYCAERQFIAANPARGIGKKLGRVQQFEPRVLTDEELAGLYAHLPERIRALTIFLGESGARASEARRLQWTNVAADCSAVTFIGTKSGKSRRVPLTARAVAALKVLQKARVKKMSGESPVFPTISGNMLDRHFHKAAKAAGLGRDVTPHSLRHGYAVALTMRGVPFSVSCELLGHSTPAFTATRYARWVPDGAAARAVAALSESRSAPGAAAKSA